MRIVFAVRKTDNIPTDRAFLKAYVLLRNPPVLGRSKTFLSSRTATLDFLLSQHSFRYDFAPPEDTEESGARKEIFDVGGAMVSLLNLDRGGTDDTDTTHAPTSLKNFNLDAQAPLWRHDLIKLSEITISVKSAAFVRFVPCRNFGFW